MSKFKVKVINSKLFQDVKVIQPEPFYDYRGEMWTFWEKQKEVLPDELEWKISKFSYSKKNVLRGLHGDGVTWKHISCVYGEIYFLVVDNRPDSSTYLKWESYVLSDKNHTSVLVPPKFLNGHLCLSDDCVFHYTQSYPNDYVDIDGQDSMRWNDKRLNINWPIDNPILALRDK